MLRGFLNAMDAANEDCGQMFLCEAAEAAAKRGDVGHAVGVAARYGSKTLSISIHSMST